MREENRNAAWAAAFVDELARAGVRDVCVASGSRCAPLVLAFASDGRFRMIPHVDERCAAYFALGMARASGRVAAVVTTSGTATANLLPAVVEASAGETPLLVLTADRPGHLRGTDANQTVEQVGLYGRYVRFAHDVRLPEVRSDLLRWLRALAGRAVAEAAGAPRGPVHLNFAFERPLERVRVEGDVPAGFAASAPVAAEGRSGRPYVRVEPRRSVPEEDALRRLAELAAGARRGLVVCGPSAEPGRTGPAALALGAAAGFPVLADVLSGARFGPAGGAPRVGLHDLILRDETVREALRPELVLRLGAAPTSAVLGDCLRAWSEVPQAVVDEGWRWKDHAATASLYVRADPAAACRALSERLEGRAEAAWTARWADLERRAAEAVASRLATGGFEAAAVAGAAAAVPDGGVLFVANSMPVRDLDAFTAPRERALRVVAHRGASGIDGNVSGALGAAAAVGRPAVAVLGDLAFYHDMNGLLASRHVAGDVVFVVIQNDGGGIFHFLPIREEAGAFEPYVAMPHGLDFGRVAALYDLPHRRVAASDAEGAVRAALAAGGVRVVEVPSDREGNRRARRAAVASVVEAVRRAPAGVGAAGAAGPAAGEGRRERS